MKHFSCDFGEGITCEVEISDTIPEAGKSHILNIGWSRKPPKSVIRPYIQWMNSVNQQCCDEWGKVILHVYKTGPERWEAWRFAPGIKPEKIDG